MAKPQAVTVHLMGSAMERAIESLSDPQVAVADALRQLFVVASRIRADNLAAWLTMELEGYEKPPLPDHRAGHNFPVVVRFDGPAGAYRKIHLSRRELPGRLADPLSEVGLFSPIAELEALAGAASSGGGPEIALGMQWIGRYREELASGRVAGMSFYVPNEAVISIEQTYLRGVCDRTRTLALKLAMDIESVDASAGDAGGPTVASTPAINEAIAGHLTLVFASNSTLTVASGANASVTQVRTGDVGALLTAARSFVGEEAVIDLESAIDTDGGEPSTATRTVLDRVRSGAYALAGGMTVNGAYDGLLALLHQTFPGFVH